jgi:hypothetical protein
MKDRQRADPDPTPGPPDPDHGHDPGTTSWSGPWSGHRPRPRHWPDGAVEPWLCTAIVDRLTFDAAIIETGTDSYRLAQTRARAGATAG